MKYFFYSIGLFLSVIQLTAQIPSGYYNTATGSGYSLKTQLHHIIDDHNSVSYSGLWSAYADTDIDPEDGYIWDMYSENPSGADPYNFTYGSNQCGNYSGESSCYNREHSFPKSWFNDASPMYTDIFHVVPTDGYVNGRRGNYPFGEVGSASWTSLNGCKLGSSSISGYSGTVFEPIDEFKGDFARIYFYMATRYEDVLYSWSSPMLDGSTDQVYEDWALEMLIDWHNNDPVSQKEIDRNNEIYSNVQGNRNPFVDHPEYVNAIWGSSNAVVTIDKQDFEGNFGTILSRTISESSSYQITGSGLEGEMTVSAEDGFQISTDNVSFGSLLHLNPSDGSIFTTIYVRFYPETAKSYNAKIAHQSNGVPFESLSVQGIASSSNSSLIFSEDFNDCDDGHQFTNYSLLGDQEWNCTGFGVNGSEGLRMNGYVNGVGSLQNEDWLVSPSIDLSGYTNATLTFQSDVSYSGNDIEVFISSNFSGNVQSATWTQLTPILDNDSGNDTWTHSGDLSLVDYTGESVVIAFKYSSTDVESARWTIDDVKVEGPDQVIWYGTHSSDAHTAANWSSGSVPTASDNVLIPRVENQVIISGDLVVNDCSVTNGGSLKVLSGASLAIMGDVTNNGQFIVERNISTSQGYSIVGAPVNETYTDDLEAELIYGVDEGIFTADLSAHHTLMVPGNGYFVSFLENTPKLTFSGTPNTGIIKRKVSEGNFELVANPYTAAISIKDFLDHNQNTVSQSVYFWDDGGQNVGAKRGGDFITVNAVGAVGIRQPNSQNDQVDGLLGSSRAMNGYIASCQGVYVETIAAGELEFTPDMITRKANSNSDDHFYRKMDDARILLAVQNEFYYNETLIGIREDASIGRDYQFDAAKMESDYPLKIYTTIGDEKFAIQAIPQGSEETTKVQVTFEGLPGSYKVTCPMIEGLNNRFVYLRDLRSNKFYELNLDNEWQITLTEFKKDFELLISGSNLLSTEIRTPLSINVEGGMLKVLYQTSGNERVNIHNLAGQKILDFDAQFIDNEAFIPFKPEENVLYILRLDDQVIKFQVD